MVEGDAVRLVQIGSSIYIVRTLLQGKLVVWITICSEKAMVSKTSTKTREEMWATERVAHLVRLAARGFNRSLSRRLAEHDITFGQWTFLRILWEHEGLTQRELSEMAHLKEPTVHAALTKMEKQGIVERRNRQKNKRKLHVFLTDTGRKLRNVLEPLAVEANELALQGLSKDAHAAFHETLILVLGNLERDEAEAAEKGLKIPATRGLRLDV